MKSEPDWIVHSDCFQKSTLLQNQLGELNFLGQKLLRLK